MKIQFCGLGHQGSTAMGVMPSIYFNCDGERKIFMKKAWEVLEQAGLAGDSVVEIVASETIDKEGAGSPYAIVTYEEGVETPAQVEMVIKFLTDEVVIDVEEPRPIKFHRCKK